MQELAQRLSTSENRKSILLVEAQSLRKSERDAVMYAALAREHLKVLERELDSVRKSAAEAQTDAEQRASAAAELAADMQAQVAAAHAESRQACAERDDAAGRMEGARSLPVQRLVRLQASCTHTCIGCC